MMPNRLFLVGSLLIAVSVCAATPAPAVNASVDTITVNGITGSVTPGTKKVYGPNDIVTVEVSPANLITYGYTVAVDDSEQLKAFIPPVVGAPETTVTAGNAVLFDEALRMTIATAAPSNPNLIKLLQKARVDVDALAADTDTAIAAVDGMERTIDRELVGNATQWPQGLTTTRDLFIIAAYGSSILTASATTGGPLDALTALKSAGQGLCSQGSFCQRTSEVTQEIRHLREQVEDAKLKDAEAEKDATKRQDFSLIEAVVTALDSRMTTIGASISSTRERVDRWKAIITRYPTPKLSQRILVDLVSRRYIVTVTRRPLSAPLPATGQPDLVSEKLSTVMFEGHTRSRFLLATGVGLLSKAQDRAFEVQTRLDGNTKKFFVAEKSTKRTEFKPLMTIGTYLSPVDNFVVDQRWTPRPFFSVGTDLSSSPSFYLVGGGIDFPVGLTLNGGITTYEATRLGKGYVVGQEIPGVDSSSDHVPLVTTATLPLRTDRKVGYYISIQFRPAIFAAFRDLAK